jgi:hypothetical protein
MDTETNLRTRDLICVSLNWDDHILLAMVAVMSLRHHR